MEKIIGIIGCKEKKLTSYILSEVLKSSGYKTRIISSSKVIDKYINSKERVEENKEKDIKILEMNLEKIKNTLNVSKNLDIIIDIDMTLDRCKINRERYLSNKIKLINNLKKDSLLIINSDDKDSVKHTSENNKCLVMTYGLNARSSITTSSIDFDNSIKFNLCLQRKLHTLKNKNIEQFEYPISTNLIEMENLYSTLAAICASLYLDVDITLISETISKLNKI